jgi:hypothetical protein
MIDTIACFVQVDHIPDHLFDGGAVSVLFSERKKVVRLWKNPKQGQYAPRVTYWRHAHGNADESLLEDEQSEELPGSVGEGLLKLEFSVAKLADCSLLANPSAAQIEGALDKASETARLFVSNGYDIRRWRVQRIDYAWMWDVNEYLPAYMSVLSQLRISNWSRHPYDVSEGVVWKTQGQRGRWVKFYNKGLELGSGDNNILRFEVSNYREAVRYMTDNWFMCERLVGEVVDPVRAVYVMAYFWDRLGLGRSDDYGSEAILERRLRDVFGERVAQAMYTLTMYRKYGTAAYQEPLELVSRSMFYRYRRELVEHGFMTSLNDDDDDDDDDATINVEYLPALHLPVGEVCRQRVLHKNLETVLADSDNPLNKNLWKNVRGEIGLTSAPSVDYFNEQILGIVQ